MMDGYRLGYFVTSVVDDAEIVSMAKLLSKRTGTTQWVHRHANGEACNDQCEQIDENRQRTTL